MNSVVKLGAEPLAKVLLRSLVCRATSAKGIEYDVSGVGRDQNRSLGYNQFKLVDSGTHFESTVAIGRSVLPEIA